jgi:membrane protein DedA with SNARE-associated domain
MPIALVFFVHYAYLIVFLWVLVEQVGIPIPSIPVLLTAGTLSATHTVNPFYIAIAVLSACLIADTIWFALGRRFGNNVLKLLCRLSFEASTCVSKTEGYFTRRGPVTLLFAKFVPGLSTVAAPIAGQTGMPYPKFLMWDLAGSLIWGETFILAGRFFGDLAKKSGPLLHWLGRFAFLIFILMVLGFLAHRIWKQRKFLQQVRELRLEPTELKEMLDAAEARNHLLSSISVILSTIFPILACSPERSASGPTNSRLTARSSLAIATSSFTAPAPARRPAPSLPCSCTRWVSTASGLFAEASTAGRKPGSPWLTMSPNHPPLMSSRRSFPQTQRQPYRPCKKPSPALRNQYSTAHPKIDRNRRLHLDSLAVQPVRPVSRCSYGIDCSALQHHRPAKYVQALDGSAPRDNRLHNDCSFDVGCSGDRWIHRVNRRNQHPQRHS